MINDDDMKLLRGFADRRTNGQTNKRTDFCDCRVAFTTENMPLTIFRGGVGIFIFFNVSFPKSLIYHIKSVSLILFLFKIKHTDLRGE